MGPTRNCHAIRPATVRGALAPAGAVACALFAGVSATAATLVAIEPSGAVAIEGERRVEVAGVRGEIVIQHVETPEMRFQCTLEGSEETPLPVPLWIDGEALRFGPAAGTPTLGGRLIVGVPPSLAVRVDATDSRLTLSAIGGPIEVRGSRLAVLGRAFRSSAKLDLVGGELVLEDPEGNVEIRGKETRVRVRGSASSLYLGLSEGAAEVLGAAGGLDADLIDAPIDLAGAGASVRLRARGGRATLSRLEAGGDFLLSGTPLGIEQSRGTIRVETDRDLRIAGHEGGVHVDSVGAFVRLERITGPIEVRADGGHVSGTGIEGAASIAGDDLQVALSNVLGAVRLELRSSQASLVRPNDRVTIDATDGSVRVEGAAAEVAVTSRGGDVRLQALAGPVRIEAGTGDVEIEWTSLPAEKESSIEAGGDVTVVIPDGGGGCRVQAESRYGRIENELSWVELSDDGAAASGVRAGGGPQHRITVRSGGRLRLASSAARSEEP